MIATCPTAAAVSSSAVLHPLRKLVPSVALLALTLAGTAGAWPFKHSGRWSGPTEMGATAVHTALLPSSTPGQSVIFWWHASPAGAPMVAGGRILWQSVDDTICAVVPSANFDFHADVTNPGFDIC